MRGPAADSTDRLRVAVTVEQSWQRVPGGTAASTNALLAELAHRPDLDVWGVAARHRSPAPDPWHPPVPVHHLPLPRAALYRSWHALRVPAVDAWGGRRPDVVHATSPAVPPAGAPLVATVHDLAFLDRPDLYTPRGVRFLARGTDLARRHAAAVVVPSRVVERECLAAGFDQDRLHVVGHGVAVPEVPAGAVAALRRRLDLPGPYVVWCGTHEPRKNLAGLLQAFELLLADGEDLHLLLVGPEGWGPQTSPPARVAARVRTAGFLPPEQLHAAYAGAAVMAYPSLSEGFGMPVLEAMAHGVPVVTSRGSAMAEFVGAAGVLVDPTDPADVARGVRAAAGDEGTMGRAGLAAAAERTWERAADRLAEVYRAAAGTAPQRRDRAGVRIPVARLRVVPASSRSRYLDDGPLRSAYLGAITGARRALDGTALLRGWDARTARHPRSPLAHVRTLLAVHNAEDLVALDLPWWTYQAIDHVNGFLAGRGHRARVFEYGSGASTLWLARRCTSLDAVEHDADWAARVRELVAGAEGLRCTPVLHVPDVPEVPAGATPVVASGAPSGQGLDFAAYVRTVEEVGGEFDLVTVDGRAREASLLASLEHVAPDGLLLLDDAQRPRYLEVVREAERRGWHSLRTRGATPCQPVPRETVLLSRHPIGPSRR